MEPTVVRLHKITKMTGAVGVIIALIAAVVCVVTGEWGFIALTCLFGALGGLLLVAYGKQYLMFTEREIIASYILKKSIHISYEDISYILIVSLHNQVNFNIVDKSDRCVLTVDTMMAGGFLEALAASPARTLEIIDVEEMVEKDEDISRYWSALNRAQRKYYEGVANIDGTVEEFRDECAVEDVRKIRKRLKIMGWTLIAVDVVAFLIGGRVMLFLYIAVVLTTYGVYIKLYPYIFFETVSKKAEKDLLRLPFFGVVLALLMLLMVSDIYDQDFSDWLVATGVIAVLFLIPFVVKSSRITVKQRALRNLAVVFAVIAIAFSVSFPVNLLFTFDVDHHDEITISDKSYTSGKNRDWYVWVDWRGEEAQFSVTKSEYEEIDIGDDMRVCVRESIFGLEYWTVHE